MTLCDIFNCKTNLLVTFLPYGNHVAHVQRERDALDGHVELAFRDMELRFLIRLSPFLHSFAILVG